MPLIDESGLFTSAVSDTEHATGPGYRAYRSRTSMWRTFRFPMHNIIHGFGSTHAVGPGKVSSVSDADQIGGVVSRGRQWVSLARSDMGLVDWMDGEASEREEGGGRQIGQAESLRRENTYVARRGRGTTRAGAEEQMSKLGPVPLAGSRSV
jgi:hypothetical protein